MGCEIERKFLLADDSWRDSISEDPVAMEQGYFLRVAGGPTVRIRIAGNQGYITVKGSSCNGVRSEYEYSIPAEDAGEMLREFCGSRIVRKKRYFVPAGNGLVWEIDEYLDQNSGLYTAEIELPAVGTAFEVPPWLGKEITGDRRYNNAALSRKPYTLWSREDQSL